MNIEKQKQEYQRLVNDLEEFKDSQKLLCKGAIVTTKGGKRVEIDHMFYDEACSKSDFHRWHCCFPYEAEHGAMSHDDEIVAVEFPED